MTCLCFHRKTRELALALKDKAIEAQVGHLFYLFFINFEAKTRNTSAQKLKFSIKDFFNKCDQIHRELRILSHLLKKALMENFIFCAVHLADL